jgi:hypothetical protein
MRQQFDRTQLALLLSRCTTPSAYYDRLFRWFWEFRGSKLEYGTDVSIERIANDIRGNAPFVVFKSEGGKWSATTVISVTNTQDVVVERQTYNLYLANGIEYISLSEGMIDDGYLQSRDWKVRIKRAIYSPCAARFLPATLDYIKSLPSVQSLRQ